MGQKGVSLSPELCQDLIRKDVLGEEPQDMGAKHRDRREGTGVFSAFP